MFQVVTLNANGLRSAVSKGLLRWLARRQPDVFCMQEVKAQQADLSDRLLNPAGLHAHFHFAEARGYSGAALCSRRPPRKVSIGFGVEEFDREGRYVEAEFSSVTVISVYFPSGSSSAERQRAKFRFLDAFLPHLKQLRKSGREILLCGDVNIAHREIDLKNWRSNRNNSGFLPEERAWIGHVLDELGWVDVYRRLYPDTTGESYTWWSNRGQAWSKNVGWRIDYQIATPKMAARARRCEIYKARRFSDHAPLIVEYSGRL
ncbi:MAG TPA: exodeoxyribonuclease III [Burkholderiaceae bacterium]